jgi:hypothetical protein
LKRISRTKIYLLRVAANFFALPHSLSLSLAPQRSERKRSAAAAILAVHEWHELCFAITTVDGEIWARELGCVCGVGGMRLRRLKFSRPYRPRKRTFDHRRRFICDAAETAQRKGNQPAPAVSQKLCDSESLISLFIWQK